MKTIMYPAISLDGFIAKPDGDSFSWVNQEDEARYDEAVKRYGCVLAGHKTYEEYKEDFHSKKNVVSYICTNSSRADEGNIKFINGTPQEMLNKIEEQGFSEIIICGGGEINGLFASAGLVKEIFISIQPVVLGKGIPLFGPHKPMLKLQLLSTNQDIKGVIQNHYKVINEAGGNR